MDPRNLGVLESFSSAKLPPSTSRPLKIFYRGEPMALGITQILTGILEIAFGLVLDMPAHNFFDIVIQTPLWSGILYIISGSLSVAAAKKPKMALVKGALGMNVVSAVAAGLVIIISSFSMSFSYPPYCHHYDDYESYKNETIQGCSDSLISYDLMYNTVAILLFFTVLNFLLAIVTAAFGCASVCRNAYSETTVVIFQGVAETSAPPVTAP
ncbi:membrane-spanning 4-domains subfamily A member 4A-like isoform X1 [Heteronotia binoei]|uniref:membrane-spanning 4-domains subfamily A member 4A-like isoform X1 n=1 Tax=Heteronotia binoei TaxID=13085 RepID=UPI00292D02DB|nr:membrane-spanning 4-domains subfamily A member 4A-like isoform X1 [Heteronotia binoei]XP_060114564.1 membrane-spanning 4-domains subfamily A member 4A-like isoform X1 [Heteronotia binoei]